MREISLPVPPNFEAVMGYMRQPPERYVGFYWMPAGDELAFDDGRCSGTINCWGWLAFVRHPAVAATSSAYDFGSSNDDARHWLVLDARERRFFVSEVADARRFLRGLVADASDAPMEPSDAAGVHELPADLLTGWGSVAPPDPAEVMRRMQDGHRQVAQLVEWLDRLPAPPRPPDFPDAFN